MEVDDAAVATLLRRVCTLESQMNEIKCFLLKFLGFLYSREGDAGSPPSTLNEKNHNSAAKTSAAPCKSIVFNANRSAVVENCDGDHFRENATTTSPVFPPPCQSTSTICKNDEGSPCCNGDDITTESATAVSTCGDGNLQSFSPDDLHSEPKPKPRVRKENVYDMKKLNHLNPFRASSHCGTIDEKFKSRRNFPAWTDAWVVLPPSENNSTTSDENISLSDSIDMLSAMGGRDDFGLEFRRRWPSPRTPCFHQHHVTVQVIEFPCC